MNGKFIKTDLIVTEEVVFLNGLHHEAFTQNRRKFTVEVDDAVLVLIMQVLGEIRAEFTHLLVNNGLHFFLINLVSVLLALLQNVFSAACGSRF